jgi:CRP-like cAMP-binding protein
MSDFLMNKGKNGYQYLGAMDCLNLLTDDEKKELIANKVDLEFEPHETIVKRGILADNVLYLTEGLVKLEIVNDSKPYTVGLTSSHSFIGIVCCFAFKKFDFTATALLKTNVSYIPMEIFEKFIKNNGVFALGLIKHISGVANGLLHRITSISQKNIEGALAMMLLEFAKIFDSLNYELPVGRNEFASLLGYSKESVINTLSKYNKEGILKVDDRKIEIIEFEKLEQISMYG